MGEATDAAIPAAMAASVMQSSPVDLLVAAIKSSNIAAVKSMLVQFPQAAHGQDSQDGATPAHWAALFGQVEVLKALAAEGARFDQTVSASGMQPIHWASTHGHTEVVKFLLAQGCSVDALDVKKTTPLVIAAQYDHSVLVFFLAKSRADITLLDDCNDSALHWAAYKGNQQTTALLHYLGLPADAADSYGSTPLHLAASRNAPHVIEYLIDEHTGAPEALVGIKDNKDRTALDIALERGHHLAVRILRRATPTLSQRAVRMIMGTDGAKTLFLFYIINGPILCYLAYYLMLYPAVGSALQHKVWATSGVLMQIAYFRAHTVDPGEIDLSKAARQKYEDALLQAADGAFSETGAMPALCHTCRIVKPLRSKHCTTLKRCVPMFDHYCPYIGNTIGGANYVDFCAFIFLGLVNVGLSVLAGVQYLWTVSSKSALIWIYLMDYSMVLLMAVMMNQYHLSLILRHLTTNEDMNKHRYHYLRNDLNQYRNPFSKGLVGNCCEVFSRRSYVLKDPYAYAEEFKKVVSAEGRDIEMQENGYSSGGERESLTPHSHDHGHSHSHH